MGGKQALCPTILRCFPPGFRNMTYVEVFGGGGSVLLNKERSVREVLNDANGNLINLYRVVREHPDELKDRLLYVLHSRLDFKTARHRLELNPSPDPIQRAADFYQVILQSYGCYGKQFNPRGKSMWARFPLIDAVCERLQYVVLENDDFETIIQRYEGGAVYREVLISNYDTIKRTPEQLYLFAPQEPEERKILWNGLC